MSVYHNGDFCNGLLEAIMLVYNEMKWPANFGILRISVKLLYKHGTISVSVNYDGHV